MVWDGEVGLADLAYKPAFTFFKGWHQNVVLIFKPLVGQLMTFITN